MEGDIFDLHFYHKKQPNMSEYYQVHGCYGIDQVVALD